MKAATRQHIDLIATLIHRYFLTDCADYCDVDTNIEAQGIDVMYVLTEKFDGYLR